MMNKLIKIFSIVLLIALVIFQYTVVSNAADADNDQNEKRTEIILKTSSTKVKAGDEIKVYIYLSNVKLDTGIAYVEGNIEFDKEVLEPITTNDSTYNGWTANWNTETGKISVDRGNLTSTEQEIAELTFKVKENTTKTSADITFKDIKVANDFDEDTAEDVTLLLIIEEDNNTQDPGDQDNKDDDDENNKGNTNNGANENNNNGDTNEDEGTSSGNDNKVNNNDSNNKPSTSGTSSSGSSNSQSNSQTKGGNIPYTGTTEWIIGAVGLVAIIGIISYMKYKKYKNI